MTRLPNTSTSIVNNKIPFTLTDQFIEEFVGKQPAWGPIGYVTYKRTYARDLADASDRLFKLGVKYGLQDTEEFWLTCVRVVEGTFRIQQKHCLALGLPWSNSEAQVKAQDMFRRMWGFKWLPPGRGLWMMGTSYIEERGAAALNNCAFVSTQHIDIDLAAPFSWGMDMLMLGAGVGADTKGAGKMIPVQPVVGTDLHVVEDTREGWVALIQRAIDAFSGATTLPFQIDVSLVRPYGDPIKSFGGKASGPAPLLELYEHVVAILSKNIGTPIRSQTIVDLFNCIGRCVVAGNVRRSAEIMLGDPQDEDFLNLKTPEKTDKVAYEAWRWASNNSIFATVGMDYSRPASYTEKNGEIGYLWLENTRKYGRTKDPINYKDYRVAGTNPCGEQPLESFEMCCLVENFPAHCDNFEDFISTLKVSYMYAKTVTLIPTHDERTNEVMMRNRRIGCSLTGIIQAINRHGRREMFEWCDQGYEYLTRLDSIYSEWLCVPKSIKMTSVKPSGTVSLLCGATPGIHFPEDEFYFRVIRFATGSDLVETYRKAGYRVEELDHAKNPNTTVVYFPVQEKFFSRGKRDVTLWEQLELAAQMQHYWADNQVSCTVTFRAHEAKDIKNALELYETRLKSISFLPLIDNMEEYAAMGYEHIPYQRITEEQYRSCVAKLGQVSLASAGHEQTDKFCDGDACIVPQLGKKQ